SKYNYPGGQFGGPIAFGDEYTKNRDKLFFFLALEGQRQQVDSGSHLARTFTQAMRNGDYSELLANRGSNLNSIPQLKIPQGFPNAGDPAPNNNMAPYMTPFGQYFASLTERRDMRRHGVVWRPLPCVRGRSEEHTAELQSRG